MFGIVAVVRDNLGVPHSERGQLRKRVLYRDYIREVAGRLPGCFVKATGCLVSIE
jgi:hypothetical protein